MNYITPAEVVSLTTCDTLKAMSESNLKIYIAGAESMLDNYKFNSNKEGFSDVIKLGVMLLIDFVTFSNIGGGAYESERIGSMVTYNMRDNGLKKIMQEVETVLGPYIISGSSKQVRKSRIVRVRKHEQRHRSFH